MLRDIKYALRILSSRVGFTAAAVISLALGIGACTAIFSVVDAVLLRSLPYPDADRVVQLREVSEKGAQMPVTEPNYLDASTRNETLEALAQYAGDLTTVTGGVEPVRAHAFFDSSDFFRVVGVQPAAGRAFLPEESRRGGRAVAVVSYAFWQRLLGGRSDFENMNLTLFDQSFNVVGIMPQGFNFPRDTEVWIPREVFPSQTSRTAHNWSVIGRVRPGISVEQARADLSAIGKQLRLENGKQTDAVDLALIPLQEYLVGNVRTGLLVLLGAVGFCCSSRARMWPNIWGDVIRCNPTHKRNRNSNRSWSTGPGRPETDTWTGNVFSAVGCWHRFNRGICVDTAYGWSTVRREPQRFGNLHSYCPATEWCCGCCVLRACATSDKNRPYDRSALRVKRKLKVSSGVEKMSFPSTHRSSQHCWYRVRRGITPAIRKLQMTGQGLAGF